MTFKSTAWWRVGVSLAAYLLACGAFLWVRHRGAFPAIVAIFAVALLGMRVHRICSDYFSEKYIPSSRRWRLIGLVVGAGLVLFVGWLLAALDLVDTPFRDGAGFFGVALLYIGIGLGLQQVRRWANGRTRFVWVLVASLAVTGLLLGAAALGAERALLIGLLVGLLTIPIGIALMSETAFRVLSEDDAAPGSPWWRSWWACALAGAVLLAGGLGLLLLADVGRPYVALLGVGAVVVMLGVAARSNVDAVLVVAAAAVIWTLGQSSVPEPDTLRPGPGEEYVVALGDSYISGEGASEYYAGTNQKGGDSCRRAPTAYPAQLMLERLDQVPGQLVFLACSGAKAPQVGGMSERGRAVAGTQLAQLQRLRQQADGHISFVLVSAGGNDALFGTLGQACVLPIDCTPLEEAWTDNLVHVGDVLETLYRDLHTALPGVDVYAVPYPIPVAEHDCDYSAFSEAEHRFLARYAGRLNDTIAAAAAAQDVEVVTTMPRSLEEADQRLCDAKAGHVGVNFIAANSVFGTLEQSANPQNWIHNSLHPNARGHEAMRAALVKWLVDKPAAPADEDGATLVSAVADAPCRGEAGDELNRCAQDWMAREAAQTILSPPWLFTMAAIGIGAWLLALQLIRLWRMVYPVKVIPEAAPATAGTDGKDAKDDG